MLGVWYTPLNVWYKSVNFGAKNSLGSPDWYAHIYRDIARALDMLDPSLDLLGGLRAGVTRMRLMTMQARNLYIHQLSLSLHHFLSTPPSLSLSLSFPLSLWLVLPQHERPL